MLHLNIKKNEFFLFCIQIALIFFNFVTTKFVQAERNESALSMAEAQPDLSKFIQMRETNCYAIDI